MSTKFAVRPAPRKRPWLCKRSPPCLDQPPQPQTFMASFFVEGIPPNPTAESIEGSMLLERVLLTDVYYGRLAVGPAPSDFFECWWNHAQPAWADCAWQVDLQFDSGATIKTFIGETPGISYEAFEAFPTTLTWKFRLFITG